MHIVYCFHSHAWLRPWRNCSAASQKESFPYWLKIHVIEFRHMIESPIHFFLKRTEPSAVNILDFPPIHPTFRSGISVGSPGKKLGAKLVALRSEIQTPERESNDMTKTKAARWVCVCGGDENTNESFNKFFKGKFSQLSEQLYKQHTPPLKGPIWPGRVLPPSWGGQYLFYLCDECPGAIGIHVEEQVIRWARLSSKLVDWILTNFDSAWLWTACESLESQPLKGKDGMCTVYYLVSLHADFVWAHELPKSQWNLFFLPHVFFLNQILWPLMPTKFI